MSDDRFPRSTSQTAAHQATQAILTAVDSTQLTNRLPIHYVTSLGYQSIINAYSTPESLDASKHTSSSVLGSESRVFLEEAAQRET